MSHFSTTSTLSLAAYSDEARLLISAAQGLADEKRHMLVEPIHLLAIMLDRHMGVRAVFTAAGVKVSTLQDNIQSELALLPRSSDGLAYFSRAMIDCLSRAEREPMDESRQTGVASLLNAVSQELKGGAARALQNVEVYPGTLRPHMKELEKVATHLTKGQSGGSGVDGGAGVGATLFSVVKDLRELSKKNLLHETVGQEDKLLRLNEILLRESKNHSLLVGEHGVGKTALVHSFVHKLEKHPGSPKLKSSFFFELDAHALVGGAKSRAECEERWNGLCRELKKARPFVLYLPNFEVWYAAHSFLSSLTESFLNAVNRGEWQMIVDVTPEGKKKMEERDSRFSRWFTELWIEPPKEPLAQKIVHNACIRLEKHHGVTILEEAASKAVTLASRYMQRRFLPDSALDLLDETCAHVVLKHMEEGRVAEKNHPYEQKKPEVLALDVASVLEHLTGIPAKKVLEAETEKLRQMESRLADRVVGQSHAIRALARAVKRSRVGLRDTRKPIGSFLFLGPSGVGKTELAKALAEFLFDDELALTRLDMSEFMEKHMAQRLLGAPPGYADSEQGGFLTEAVRKRPYSVLLFDEIEKAHPDVFNLLLQLLDDGRLTDGRGNTADFSNTVIVMTSNLGADLVLKAEPLAIQNDEKRDLFSERIRDELKSFLRPEFINRIDETLLFEPLEKIHLKRIVDLEWRRITRLAHEHGFQFELSESAKDFLVDQSYDPAFGARPLKRSFLRYVQDLIADYLLHQNTETRDTSLHLVIEVHDSQNELKIVQKKPEEH